MAAASALLVHSLVAALVWRVQPRAVAQALPADETEIELQASDEIVEAPAEPTHSGEAPAPPSAGAHHAPLGSTARASQGAAAAAEAIVDDAPGARSAWSLPLFRDPGSAPWPMPAPSLNAAALAETPAPTPKSAGGLAKGLHEADVRRGFGRAGAVLSAAEKAVHGEASLLEGRARYEAHVDGSGQLRVTLLDATRDRRAWEGLTSSIAKQLDVGRLRLAQGAAWRGIVEVEVRMQYRDGTQPKDLGNKAVVSKGRLRENPNVDDLPGVALMHRGKVCSGGLYLGAAGAGLAGGCSLENIGAVAQRVVRGRVIEEEML